MTEAERTVVEAAIAWHRSRYPDLIMDGGPMDAFNTSDRLHEAVERLDTESTER